MVQSWTEVADVNTARDSVYGAGTSTSSTAAIAFGGQNTSRMFSTVAESWNGSCLDRSRQI